MILKNIIGGRRRNVKAKSLHLCLKMEVEKEERGEDLTLYLQTGMKKV